MTSRFDWRTDDDSGWETPPAPPPPAPDRGRRLRRLLLLALPLLLLLLLVAWQLNQRADEATDAAGADVLSGYTLVRRAVDSQDGELLTAALSGRDPDWTAGQQALLENDLLLDRAPLGLRWSRIAGPAPTLEDVTLAPDLTAAELQLAVNYRVTGPDGTEAGITLTQTQVYRRHSSGRWLLSPPLEEFWGSTETISGTYLTVNYPGRDAPLVARLAADLDQALTTLCAGEAGLSCPAGRDLTLTFSSDPADLLALADPALWSRRGLPLRLPAPTLIGIPGDEAGYRQLLQIYAYQLLPEVVNAAAGVGDAPRSLLYQALLEQIVAPTGLVVPPAGDEAADRLLTRLQPPANYADIWGSGADPRRENPMLEEATLLASFIAGETAGGPPLNALENLARYVTFDRWLEVNTGGESRALFEPWARFLQQVGGEGDRPLPGSVLLTCTGDDLPGGAPAALLAAAPDTPRWQTLTGVGAPFFALPLPATGDFLLFVGNQGRFINPRSNTLTLWQDGELRPVGVPDDGLPSVDYAGTAPPTVSLASLFRFDLTGSAQAGNPFQYALLDLESCNGEDCRLVTTEGYNSVSPDGAHYLVDQRQAGGTSNLAIYRRDGALTAEHTGVWGTPFWLKDGRFVVMDAATNDIFLGRPDAPALQPVGNLSAIINTLELAGGIWLDHVLSGAFVYEERPDELLLFLFAYDRESRTQRNLFYLVGLDLNSGAQRVLNESIAEWTTASQSPTGRYIALHNWDGDSDTVVNPLLLLDLAQPDREPIILTVSAVWRTYLSWSDGDRHLLTAHGDFFRVFDLTAYENHLYFAPETVNCTQAFWFNRER